MAELLAEHLWMPDRRSLCDTQAPKVTNVAAMSDDEFESWIHDQRGLPACGACLLLVSYLRAQASGLLLGAAGRVAPASPSEAWARLRETRWMMQVDIDGLLRRPGLDLSSRFDALNDAIDPARGREAATERARELEDIVNRRRRKAELKD